MTALHSFTVLVDLPEGIDERRAETDIAQGIAVRLEALYKLGNCIVTLRQIEHGQSVAQYAPYAKPCICVESAGVSTHPAAGAAEEQFAQPTVAPFIPSSV